LKLDSGVLDATPLNNSQSLFERKDMRHHASNPAAGYEVGVTNAVTRKVLMTTGQKLDPPSSYKVTFHA
jgi:hypothetical protein